MSYPTVDIEFFSKLLSKNNKVEGIIKQGTSVCYIIKGNKPIGERIIIIRNEDDQVDFEFATGTATRLKCMGELLEWLEKNRNWKDGGYFK